MFLHRSNSNLTPLDAVRPLIVTEEPIPGESLLGLISRNLANTSLDRLRPALGLAGIGTLAAESLPRSLDVPDQIAALARFLGTTPDEIKARLYPTVQNFRPYFQQISFNGVLIRPQYRERRIRRVSPQALKSSSFHRVLWEIRPISFDGETLEPLLDTCPVCSKRLGWTRLVPAHMCDHCFDENQRPSVDLRDFPQARIDIEDVEAASLAPRLLSHDPLVRASALGSLSEEWRNLPLADVFESIVLISTAVSNPVTEAQRRVSRPKVEELGNISAESVARTCRAMLDGENALDDLIEEVRDAGTRRPGKYSNHHLYGSFGAIPTDPWVPLGARSILSRSFYRLHQRRNTFQEEGFIDALEVCRRFGVSLKTANKIAASGLVEVKQRAQPGLRRYVRASQVEAIVTAIKGCEFPKLPGIYLSSAGFAFLASKGLLSEVPEEVCAFASSRVSYTKDSLAHLLETLNRPLTPGSQSVPVDLVLSDFENEPFAWPAAIAVMALGDFHGVRRDPNARRNWRSSVEITDVDGFKRQLAETIAEMSAWSTVSPVEAAQILGASVNFVYRGVKTGALASLPGYPCRFARTTVDEFRKDYIFGSELEQHFGVQNLNRTQKHLAEMGVNPAFTGNRDLIYRRENLPDALI